jgi:hypothetical protein
MFRRSLRIGLAGALIASLSVVGLAGPAGAAGGEHGALRIHGPGSVFAGSRAWVTSSVTAGGTATFAMQVKNTGTSTAQYNVDIESIGNSCGGPCPPETLSFAAGSLIATKLAAGPNGYFTPPIDPGKTGAFTFKVITPKTAPPGSAYYYRLNLRDTALTSLDYAYAYAFTTRAHGTSGADQFVSASGTAATGSDPAVGNISVTAPTVAVGGSAIFTVKLQNNGTVPGPIHYQLGPPNICGSFFSFKVAAGSLDVTTLVTAGTYSTVSLAHGAAVSLKVTVTYLASAASCFTTAGVGYTYMSGLATDDHAHATNEFLVIDPVAFN